MPAIAITKVGTRLDAPSLVLRHDQTDPIHLICALRKADNTGDQTFEDVETYCAEGAEAPGATKQALDVEVLWSYGATGAYNVLKPFEDQLVTFAFMINGGNPVSASNPELSGQLYVPFIPFVRADGVKKYMYVPLSFKINGTPVSTTVAPAVYAGHTGIS